MGDDINPFASDGYAPIDERAGRANFDAQKTSGNTDDLRGKILRIHPEPGGTYTIPSGNLFPQGTAKTQPEIYAMGFRNPFRFAVDSETGWISMADYGPDAGNANANRGLVLAAEPAHHHDRLPERAQGSAAFRGATQSAFFVQEPRDVLNECVGDVERGTMSNHVEPFGLERSCGESSSTGGSTSVSSLRRLLPKGPECHGRCPRNPNRPNYFAEITSLRGPGLVGSLIQLSSVRRGGLGSGDCVWSPEA